MKAELPSTESQRLRALASYAVLDTPPESSFDELVQLASQMCDTSIALVSLVDERRQWFKARVGMSAQETPRDVAFCAHAILSPSELFEVVDAHQDRRFSDNPLVTGDSHIRFYSGAPLVTPAGDALGTLCVLDTEPRELTAAQRHALKVLARQVMTLLELRLALTQRDQDRSLNLKLARAVEQSPVSIVVANLQGNIEYVNPAFERLTGYCQEESMGRNPRFLQSGNKTKEEYRALWQTVTSGQTWQGEFRNKKKNGDLFWEQASISPVTNVFGLTTHYVAVKEDITERRRIEAQLRAKNEELKSFSYTVSHDLKAPLRGIAGYARELQRKHQAGMGERAVFCLNQIQTATKNLDELIEDLLKYSRLDTDEPTLSDFRLDALIQKLVDERSFSLTERGVEVDLALPALHLHSWERGLQQVMRNLISNAVKFSRNAIAPQISITASHENGVCHISVTDNGVGFDMKYHDRIFGLFNRLVKPSEFEGTGAGLAIAKKVMDKMGGTIQAHSAPGQGTTFDVCFPCARPPHQDTP